MILSSITVMKISFNNLSLSVIILEGVDRI